METKDLNDLVEPKVNTSPVIPVIGIKDFEVIKCVGAGSYGKVYQVVHKLPNKIYAMKIISKEIIHKYSDHKYPRNEKDIMTKIDHPFIVTLRYAFQSRTKLYLVMDYLPGGELFDHLRRQGVFSESDARIYLAEIVLAVDHLHSHNIIHRDLKPENILLQKDSHLSLTDFGLARYVEGSEASSLCGTNNYLAPEIIKGGGYGKTVDWWSVGALLYEMLVGRPLFQGKNANSLYKNIISLKLVFPSNLTPECTNLLKGLLFKDQSKRLGSDSLGGFNSIKFHPFFRSLDWEKLFSKEIQPPITLPITGDDIKYFDPNLLTSEVPKFLSPTITGSTSPDFQNFEFIHPDLIPTLDLSHNSNYNSVNSMSIHSTNSATSNITSGSNNSTHSFLSNTYGIPNFSNKVIINSNITNFPLQNKSRTLSIDSNGIYSDSNRNRAMSCLTLLEGEKNGYRPLNLDELKSLLSLLNRNKHPSMNKHDTKWARRLSVDELDNGLLKLPPQITRKSHSII